jgi:hypothetical protein
MFDNWAEALTNHLGVLPSFIGTSPRAGSRGCSRLSQLVILANAGTHHSPSFRGAPLGANPESRRLRGAGFRVCAQQGASRNDANIHIVCPRAFDHLAIPVVSVFCNTAKMTAVDQPNSNTPFIAVIGPIKCQRCNGVTSP